MGMGVVETGKNALEGQVEFARARGGQRENLVIRADDQEPSAADRHSLSAGLGFIDSPDVSVVQDQFRLFLTQQRQSQQAAYTKHEITARNRSHSITSRFKLVRRDHTYEVLRSSSQRRPSDSTDPSGQLNCQLV